MKKYFIFATVVAMFAFSCNKEAVESKKNFISLTADGEEVLDTKATLNNNLVNVWDSSDEVGLVVSNSNNSWYTNQKCTVTNGANTTDATFTSTQQYNDADKWNIAAFYPWNGSGDSVNNWYSGDNNAYNGTMYFKLPASYSGYTSGKSYLPMIANLSGDNTHPTEMHFKHVGAGVRVKVENLPVGASYIEMTVDGQQITGDFAAFNPANAGTAAIVGAGNTSNNKVTLSFTALTAEADWEFIFPVPELTTPTLTFKVFNSSNKCIWQKKASSQPSVSRAHILSLPDVPFDPTNIFYISGFINGSDQNKVKAFSKGKAKYTFTSNSYVYIQTLNDDNYWFPDYVSTTSGNAFIDYNGTKYEKMLVPAGTVTFSLTIIDSNQVSLSYTTE